MSALEAGKAKLGDIISFKDLPKDRNDNLWSRIENDCHLTLGELSALKNAVCSSGEAKKTDEMLIKVLKKQGEMMMRMAEVLEEVGDKDCYDRISESSKSRELVNADYARQYSVPVPDLKCMITGISQTSLIAASPSSPTPKNPVTLAHLLARNADAKERLSLGFGKADIESIRNSILLCKRIEEAFHHKFLSFVPADTPFSSNRYKMHIWVDAIRSESIYEGATQTIGSYDGAALDLKVGSHNHNPFRRAMSYQAFRAFKTWGKGFGLTELPEDSDTSVYHGSYKLKRAAFAKQLAKDVVADAEEDDDEDEGGSEETEDDA